MHNDATESGAKRRRRRRRRMEGKGLKAGVKMKEEKREGAPRESEFRSRREDGGREGG